MFGFKKEFIPDWTNQAPLDRSYRSIFKWGDPHGFKHPNKRLYRLMKETFHLTDNDFRKKKEDGNETVACSTPMAIPEEAIQMFQNMVGEENVNTDGYARVRFSNGKTMEEAMMLRKGETGQVADIVIHPRHKTDVQKIVQYCNERKIPVYTYGGGSSVNFGFKCVKGGVSLVMSTHMNRVVEINETNQTATVEAGIMGPAYEDALNRAPEMCQTKRRYTCGHFPQSFEYSTVGGWILALGSGQQSSYYGDACDIVLSQEYITPTGSFKTLDFPGTATGPKVNDIMKGSEGVFGILVSVTMKIFRYMPENRRRFSYIFPSWEKAVAATRDISQGEFGMPSVFRISDPEETDVALKLYGVEGTILDKLMDYKGYRKMERCLYIGHTEGEKGFSKNVAKNVRRICKKHGAMSLTGYPVKKWEHSRYQDPYMREDLHDFGVIIDTLETGVTWDNLHRLHQGVRRFAKTRPETIIMTHASHFYPQGTNLYFIFIGRFSSIEDYRTFQKGLIDSILEFDGSLSHHHGVGKMIGPWMERHLGKPQMDVLRALKHHFDPNHILNPGGTLGLD